MAILEQLQERLRYENEWIFQERALLDALRKYSYDSYLFGLIPDLEQRLLRPILYDSNIDQEWRKRYKEQEYSLIDPLVKHCAESQEPRLWSSTSERTGEKTLSPRQKQLVQEAEGYGYIVGVTIPLFSPQCPLRFGASFSIRGSNDFEFHDQQFRENEQTIIGIAQLLFMYVRLHNVIIDHFNLTIKNIRVLKCLALGKTKAEIMEEMGVADHVLKYQLRSIREKMNTRTTEQALSLFVSFGLSHVKLD